MINAALLIWPVEGVMKVLFVLKRGGYGNKYGYGSTGLFNSSKFVVDMLNDNGIEAKEVVVTDNNDIDREVFTFKPDVVFIEALWVVPEKFDILKKLHPRVRWVVRVHSDIPFLANEGISVDWIFGYLARDVEVAFNDHKTFKSFRAIDQKPGDYPKIAYLPNFYPVRNHGGSHKHRIDLHIGCFGAIRPLKNQLTQAVAAIKYADSVCRTLRFYVNATRLEGGGENIIKNLRALFANTQHELVEVPWLNRADFLKLLRQMDLAMCVSFTETFCIVAADAVSVDVPLVCSDQVPWATGLSIVKPTEVAEIANRISAMLGPVGEIATFFNRRGLRRFSERARETWLEFLN